MVKTPLDDDPMTPLVLEFTYQGRIYRQLKRDGRIAIYEIFKGDTLRGFETIVIQLHKAGMRFGNWYPNREGYPSNEEWGTYGWSYLPGDLKGAERCYKRLLIDFRRAIADKTFRLAGQQPRRFGKGFLLD